MFKWLYELFYGPVETAKKYGNGGYTLKGKDIYAKGKSWSEGMEKLEQ